MTNADTTTERAGGVIFLSLSVNDRLAISTTIERLIDFLDALEPDADLEPDGDELDASFPEDGKRVGLYPGEDDEPCLGAPCDYHGGASQLHWSSGAIYSDDREEENEDGGDILDEPHDPHDSGDDEPDADGEPWLGWGNPVI